MDSTISPADAHPPVCNTPGRHAIDDVFPDEEKSGFTLVELLVVIAILSVLMALLTPSLQQARSAAERAQCASNLRQIGVASALFASQHNGLFPSVWMLRGWENTTLAKTFYETLGAEDGPAMQASKINACPTARKVGQSHGIPQAIYYAGNRFLWWSRGHQDLLPNPAPENINQIATMSRCAFAFCGDGRWWAAADGAFYGQQPTFLHGDATVADMPNLNFMKGTCNVLFLDGHVAPMKPAWGGEAANPDSTQVPCQVPPLAQRAPWNAFWKGE